jgi:abortive infection bacteriophage resistance protein
LISELEIEQFIGRIRWTEYSVPFSDYDKTKTIECYRFDVELRGFLMSAISVIEVALVTQIQNFGFAGSFDSFGHARRTLDSLPLRTRNLIARNFGVSNFKQLRGALQNLNYLRNRVAHHERVWNHRNRFAFPTITRHAPLNEFGIANNRHVLAFSLVGLAFLMRNCPAVFEFEAGLFNLINRPNISKKFLLESMGFEVP